MSGRMMLFIILLVLNLLTVVVYLIWNHIRRKEKILSTWMKAGMMLLCPIVGPTFIFVAFWLSRLFMLMSMDLSDVVFSKERVETFIRPDEETEKNMVSLEEALEVTDKKSLRSFILNVIRGDYKNSLSSIALALNSEDTETAHYAASILQDVLSDFRAGVQEKYCILDEDEEHLTENCVDLLEYMNSVVEQRVLTDLEQRSMVERMDEVLERAWVSDRQKISSSVYEKVCQRLLEMEDYENCRKWCARTSEQYPDTLSSYTCQLKLFFSCGDREDFFRVMQELKESDITIDNETLEFIRIFM